MIIVEKKLSKHLLSLTQLNSTQLNSAQFSIKPDYLPSVQIVLLILLSFKSENLNSYFILYAFSYHFLIERIFNSMNYWMA